MSRPAGGRTLQLRSALRCFCGAQLRIWTCKASFAALGAQLRTCMVLIRLRGGALPKAVYSRLETARVCSHERRSLKRSFREMQLATNEHQPRMRALSPSARAMPCCNKEHNISSTTALCFSAQRISETARGVGLFWQQETGQQEVPRVESGGRAQRVNSAARRLATHARPNMHRSLY